MCRSPRDKGSISTMTLRLTALALNHFHDRPNHFQYHELSGILLNYVSHDLSNMPAAAFELTQYRCFQK